MDLDTSCEEVVDEEKTNKRPRAKIQHYENRELASRIRQLENIEPKRRSHHRSISLNTSSSSSSNDSP